ncbi:hypothetical protein BYT27DRAFT_7339148 [Phlegmacium glaucopus]|nr:hypothetical protein BYT27DRAFT_7339148 [Phlegmacium glaucopus]
MKPEPADHTITGNRPYRCSDERKGNIIDRHSPPRDVANHPQPFSLKFSPAQSLAGADEANVFRTQPASSEQIEDTIKPLEALALGRDQVFNEIFKLCRGFENVTDQAGDLNTFTIIPKDEAEYKMLYNLDAWQRTSQNRSLEEMFKMGATMQDDRSTSCDYYVRQRFMRYFSILLKAELYRPESTYRADEMKMKRDAKKLTAYVLRTSQLSREPTMTHHRPEDPILLLDYILSDTRFVPPRGPMRSHDNEAQYHPFWIRPQLGDGYSAALGLVDSPRPPISVALPSIRDVFKDFNWPNGAAPSFTFIRSPGLLGPGWPS